MPTTTFGKRQTFGRRAPSGNFAPPHADVPVKLAFDKEEHAAAAPSKWPLLTVCLTVILVLIFIAEQIYGVEPAQSLSMDMRTTVALGGSDRYLVFYEGEWWRIFTAPWLHVGLDHLIGNAITLLVAGTLLERMIGRGWLAALFFIGALGGSIGSLGYGATTLVSAGASGAIMCLVTALYTLSYHAVAGRSAKRLRRMALFVLVPALLPSAAHDGMQIDIGAHFGGFMAGFVLGFVLLALWPDEERAPQAWRMAATIAAAGVLVTVFSFAQIGTHYGIYAARSAALVPGTMLENSEALEEKSGDLVRRYPHDPVLRMVLAMDSLRQHYFSDAEQQLRTGLAERDMLATQFSPVIEQRMQMLLAMTLSAEGRADEARAAARPICNLSSRDEFLSQGYGALKNAAVCD